MQAIQEESYMESANELSDSVAARWNEDLNADILSVPEFEQLCEDVFAQNKKVKDADAIVEAHKDVLTAMKAKLMGLMEQLGKTKYSSNNGTVFTKDAFSVKIPRDPENKEKFMTWLKEKGIFDAMVTVNSASLVKLYNDSLEASGDPDFAIPGITEVTSYRTLTVRKG